MEYNFIQSLAVSRAHATVENNCKKSVLLSGSWEGPYAIAAIIIDNIMPKAEIHKKAVDIWQIVKGKGKFILGGIATNPETVSEDETCGDSIIGGKKVDVKPGDWIDIPAGTAHQIDARGNRLEMVIVKIKV